MLLYHILVDVSTFGIKNNCPTCVGQLIYELLCVVIEITLNEYDGSTLVAGT